MTISIRVSELDGVLFKKYAQSRHETVSAFLRRVALEQIEKDYREVCRMAEEYNRIHAQEKEWYKSHREEIIDNNEL